MNPVRLHLGMLSWGFELRLYPQTQSQGSEPARLQLWIRYTLTATGIWTLLGYTLVPSPRDMTILYTYRGTQRNLNPFRTVQPYNWEQWNSWSDKSYPHDMLKTETEPSQTKPRLQGTQRNLNPIRLERWSPVTEIWTHPSGCNKTAEDITCERSESAREWRKALHKSDQQQQVI